MGSFLANFSSSFLLALLMWPFIAALLTLPVLIAQYRRFNRVRWSYVIGVYLFMLYGLGLVSFTLYPMPDNPATFCGYNVLIPQLSPLQFIHDIQHEGVRATLQVVMNVLFFIPFGVFARLLFRWKFIPTVILALLTSLTIEVAQLTGAFGYYSCSYRLFDVDDLVLNTLGALLGYIASCLIPRSELEYAEKDDIITKAGGVRRLVGFAVDIFITHIAALVITIPIYFFDKQLGLDLQNSIYIANIIFFQFIIPYLGKGRTIGGRFTRMSLDEKERKGLQRLGFYLLRLLWVGAFLTAPYSIPVFIGIISVLSWLIFKRLPYGIL